MSSRPSAFTLTQPGRWRLTSPTELNAMKPPSWQIKGMIPRGGFIVIYGPPGCGKSFLAYDMLACISTGLDWHTRPVEYGHGLYVAAEGGTGMAKRQRHWADRADVPLTALNMAWMLESFPMQANSDEMDGLMARLLEIDTEPDIIVIDTLARCFVGAENETADMGAFIAGVDQLRHSLKCTVLVVHHTRLDGDRERGNTALRGATDAMFSVSLREYGERKIITVINDRQKDYADAPTQKFWLEPMGEGDEGSLVLTPLSGDSVDAQLLAMLKSGGAVEGKVYSYSQLLSRTSFAHKTQFTRALKLAIRRGYIKEFGSKYELDTLSPKTPDRG